MTALTCVLETLKLCIAKILPKGWQIKVVDLKTIYLQGREIERIVYVKPLREARKSKL